MTTRAERLEALPLARATQVALAVAVILFVFGSSSVSELHRVGSPLRWVALLAFTTSAALWAAAERGGVPRLLPVAVPAGALGALGVVSAAWSIDPRLTVERAATFVIALAGAGAVAAAVRGRSDAAALVAEAFVGATTLVCIAGGVLYAFDPAEAAQLPEPRTPLRFAGIGENPNTVQMIAALSAILAAWLVVRSRGRRRLLAVAGLVILCAHVAASGSRGGLLAIAFGGFCFALAAPALRLRLALLAATCGVAAAVLAGNQLMLSTIPPAATAGVSSPGSSGAPATPGATPGATPQPPWHGAPGTGPRKPGNYPGNYPVGVLPRFNSELGAAPARNRSLLGGAGRSAALLEAFHQANARPLAGFGFGTEERAFFERLQEFESARPENSFLGLYLQLGILGPLLWIVVGLAVGWLAFARARRLAPDVRLASAAFLGAVAAGYALGTGQSYVYAVGNVSTLGFWVAAFLVAGLVGTRPAWLSRRRLAVAGVVALALLGAFAAAGRREGARDRARQNAGMNRIWSAAGGLDGPTADGFRLSPPESCILYASGQEPARFELCFQDGHLVEAYDRLHGTFKVFSLRPFGPAAAAISASAAAVDARIRALYPDPTALPTGTAYLTRPIPRTGRR